jgi:hypothetical protein
LKNEIAQDCGGHKSEIKIHKLYVEEENK